jgi:hypothetical protein
MALRRDVSIKAEPVGEGIGTKRIVKIRGGKSIYVKNKIPLGRSSSKLVTNSPLILIDSERKSFGTSAITPQN